MKTNLPQHPCAGKCTEFKNEQCKTCLVRDIEKREFDLGVAPDEAYVKTESEFLVGDFLVLDLSLLPNSNDSIFEFRYVTKQGIKVREVCGRRLRWVYPIHYFRHANVAELNANRRLTKAELSQAEVS